MKMLEKHCNYRKNDPRLFEIMRPHMDIAIKRAKKQYHEYSEGTPASKCCPATTVFELVEELNQYL